MLATGPGPVMPAKPGHLLFVEYFEKTKKLDMRIEKFNY